MNMQHDINGVRSGRYWCSKPAFLLVKFHN